MIAQGEGNATRANVTRCDIGLFLIKSSDAAAFDGSESFLVLWVDPVRRVSPSTKPRWENSKGLSSTDWGHDGKTISCRRECDS
jgi:hypothetical protein